MSDTPKSPSPRRRFIASLVGGTAALAAGTVGARDLFAQGGGMPVYPPPQGGWDMSWTDKVEKAKHRLVVDCAGVDDGLALTNAQTVLAGYKDVYNTADADMAIVVVIRHKAVQMVLNDDIWAKWKIGEQLSIKDGAEPALRNTFAKGSGRGGGSSMEGLMQRGVIILCCNLALMRSAGQFATAMSMPVDEARKLFIDSLVPGIIRQTNGVFAVTRAQEAGAHFLKST
ncbi:MAG: hypothetical protein NTX19_07730 [Gemmatimonadetes bacterium]|nr:hypothetical protein [Gemmatimonadota bacterium]